MCNFALAEFVNKEAQVINFLSGWLKQVQTATKMVQV